MKIVMRILLVVLNWAKDPRNLMKLVMIVPVLVQALVWIGKNIRQLGPLGTLLAAVIIAGALVLGWYGLMTLWQFVATSAMLLGS